MISFDDALKDAYLFGIEFSKRNMGLITSQDIDDGWSEFKSKMLPPPMITDHEFKPGYSGRTCEHMVMRDGGGDQCGGSPESHVTDA